MLATVSRAPLLIGLVAAPLPTEVVRIEVHSRATVVNGRTLGTACPDEEIAGRIFFAVDHTLPANRIVTDIDTVTSRSSRVSSIIRWPTAITPPMRLRTRVVPHSQLRSRRLAFIGFTGDYRVQLVEPGRCDSLSTEP